MKPTKSTDFHTDAATGIITAKPATGVDTRQNIKTYRQPVGTITPPRANNSAGNRKGNGKSTRRGRTIQYGIGTGGNATRAIPTGPRHHTHPTTGHPIRTIAYPKWRTFQQRAALAGLTPAKLTLIERCIHGQTLRPGGNITMAKIRIDFITKSEWSLIDRTKLTKRTR